ncbi:hypothetical protein CHARACLAT_023052 [Characodon lateralis]|uniref:Uncharacterized protein n=1 Tax=Characodon lateralis TaxID=208331 RepID=A0ABU7DXG4_9TELE|nr:hypothetical protein [Characodon lateralis]
MEEYLSPSQCLNTVFLLPLSILSSFLMASLLPCDPPTSCVLLFFLLHALPFFLMSLLFSSSCPSFFHSSSSFLSSFLVSFLLYVFPSYFVFSRFCVKPLPLL